MKYKVIPVIKINNIRILDDDKTVKGFNTLNEAEDFIIAKSFSSDSTFDNSVIESYFEID